jgi:dihydroorotate dehydrogenase (NAD+) catalytic subunit
MTQTATEPMTTCFAGLTLRNPVMTASGTFGYGVEYKDYFDPALLGAVITKAVTREFRPGNQPIRTVETRAGMLNAIGLANVGLEGFLKEKVPIIRSLGTTVIVNVAGHSIDDFVAVSEKLDLEPSIAALEINISCPNVADGLEYGVTCEGVTAVTKAVRKVVKRAKLIMKLSPNVTDIAVTARAAVDAGADGLSLINTITGIAIDAEKRRPVLANVTGGLSGPAIKPVALRMVHQVYRKVAKPAGVPILGMGGIQFASDAIEFLLAGATAVAVGTATFIDPTAPVKVIEGIGEYLRRHKIGSVQELTGALQV